MTARYVQTAVTALLCILWMPALAWAGTVTLHQTLGGLSGTVVVLVVILSTLAGVTALLRRLRAELMASGGKLPYAWIFVGAHMTGAWLAGIIAFAIGEAGDVNDWLELISIILGSYFGAVWFERLAEKYLPGGAAIGSSEAKP